MQKTTFIFTFACLVLFSSLAFGHETSPHESHSEDFRKAAIVADKDCKWVAKTVEWDNPEKLESGYSFKLDINGFFVNIPPNAKRVMLFTQGDMAIAYPDKSILYITTQIAPREYNLSSSGNRTNKIAPAEAAEVVFMKTHCDKVPKYKYDAFIWNYSLMTKSAYFENPKSIVTKTESGKLTYYLSDSDGPLASSGRAIITNIEAKNKILLLSATGMAFEDFTKIVFSVTPRTYPSKD